MASAAGAAGFAGGGAAAGGRDGPLEPLDVTTRFGGAPPGGGLVGTGAAGAVGTAGGAAGGGVAAVGAAAAGAAGAGATGAGAAGARRLPEQGLPELPELAQAEEALAAVQEAALWAPEPPDLQVVVGAGLEWGVEGQLTRVEVARGAAVASGWKSQISALRRACLRARHRRLARGGGLHDRPYAGRGQRVLLP